MTKKGQNTMSTDKPRTVAENPARRAVDVDAEWAAMRAKLATFDPKDQEAITLFVVAAFQFAALWGS